MLSLSLSISLLIPDEPTFRMTKRIDESYSKIRNICLSALLGCEYKFGRHSLEYVSTIAALMDVNAMFDRQEENFIQSNDFDCLSDRTKKIFVNYAGKLAKQ